MDYQETNTIMFINDKSIECQDSNQSVFIKEQPIDENTFQMNYHHLNQFNPPLSFGYMSEASVCSSEISNPITPYSDLNQPDLMYPIYQNQSLPFQSMALFNYEQSQPMSNSHFCNQEVYSSQIDSSEDELSKKNNRRHTFCSPVDSIPSEKKKLKRKSMNDISMKRKIDEKSPMSSFVNLSKQELINLVVKLEREKEQSMQLEESTLIQLEGSDEDEIHICRWNNCNITLNSLDQLTSHIKDIHIGGGKPAYYCEWAFCPREHKPFLKRHKMQNHMRTHTGERPFQCTVEGCDKRFSRPDSLNTHIKTHSNIRPYTCTVEGCTKAYFHSRSLRKHFKSHEPTFVEQSTPIQTFFTPPPPPPPPSIYPPAFTFFGDYEQQIYAAGTAFESTTTTTTNIN